MVYQGGLVNRCIYGVRDEGAPPTLCMLTDVTCVRVEGCLTDLFAGTTCVAVVY